MTEKISVRVSFSRYAPDTVRYAAYSVSGGAYVTLEPSKGGMLVTLEPKRPASGAALTALKKKFTSELADEKLRAELAASSRGLREFMTLKALCGPAAPAPQEDSGLTPEQEKELDALIAEVESEIKTEAAGKKRSDPRGITRTWEETRDSKPAGEKVKR